MSTTLDTASPYAEGILPKEHQSELAKIRSCMAAWIFAAHDAARETPGAMERLNDATKTLADLEVAAQFAFTPSPPYPFRSVLLSCVRCYWLALIASLDESEKDEMKQRLDITPPYRDRIPRFNGAKCVGEPGSLSSQEYEGLMRVMHFVALGMVPKDVVKTWYEIGEVGVQTWEEIELE